MQYRCRMTMEELRSKPVVVEGFLTVGSGKKGIFKNA